VNPKSEKKSGSGKKLFQKGGDPRRGRGPAKGAPNAGRPKDEFKQRMAEKRDRESVQAFLDECLEGKHGPDMHLKALRFVTEYSAGKPSQAVDVSVSGKLLILTDPEELDGDD
jgi:hypothetical protein